MNCVKCPLFRPAFSAGPPCWLPLANRASPTIFRSRKGRACFFSAISVFFEQTPTLNRKKSFRCAKGRAFPFFSGRKKFFLSPKRASPTSSPYSPEVMWRQRHWAQLSAVADRPGFKGADVRHDTVTHGRGGAVRVQACAPITIRLRWHGVTTPVKV